VAHGRKLGRTLGFRTLNVRVGEDDPPRHGIYVVRVHELAAQPLPGVCSIGVRPTIEAEGETLLEAHCLEWPLELEAGYGRAVRVELLHKLRDEQRFHTLAALTDAIAADVEAARSWFAACRPPSSPPAPRKARPIRTP
jgi:riboflavin kinase/FMN adenylyltransferase